MPIHTSLLSFCARSKASSDHSYQSWDAMRHYDRSSRPWRTTGFEACWSRYGDLACASLFWYPLVVCSFIPAWATMVVLKVRLWRWYNGALWNRNLVGDNNAWNWGLNAFGVGGKRENIDSQRLNIVKGSHKGKPFQLCLNHFSPTTVPATVISSEITCVWSRQVYTIFLTVKPPTGFAF